MSKTGGRQWLNEHRQLGWWLLIGLVAVFWLWRGELYQAQEQLAEVQGTPQAPRLTMVEARWLQARRYRPELVLQGQLLPARQVSLRARINAIVVRVPVLGERVAEGELMLALSEDDRRGNLLRAEAELALQQAEVTAAERLRRNNLVSETELLAQKAAAAAARAALDSARLALAHTRVTAPFAGSIDALPVEAGDVVQAGDELLTLVDVSALKMTAQVPQQQVAGLEPGLPVTAVLLDGQALEGTLTFVARSADPQTRSYALEARFDNPRQWRVAGASASLHVRLPEQPAYRLSPALLTLDGDGRPGVKTVDEANRVRFMPVTLLGITPGAAWVGGLPARVRLITRGAGFAAQGEEVTVTEREPAA
ncbi:efflux transporter periplasmic adaptor subunit [Zobellella endophytica]|uniref:Efflux transporter periplasmic adaptor subunit n=1 Tax=Zobellella endophytica TaxID=2116700 RepID=A0A2P7RB82_9GAMM|nr:efflux RND transporter periplasmic adaptor subunit [Zobellella endophytica]PSJ47494.1 efflux transporter periplasmic adaptor subunit [Zobellella endophytica]